MTFWGLKSDTLIRLGAPEEQEPRLPSRWECVDQEPRFAAQI